MRFTFRFKDSGLEIVSDEINQGTPEYTLLCHLLKTDAKCLKYELGQILDAGKLRNFTSMRAVQQYIRNLRELRVPIVSDVKGVWIANKISEVKEYIDWLTRKAESDIKSMLHVRNQLCSMINEAPKLFI